VVEGVLASPAIDHLEVVLQALWGEVEEEAFIARAVFASLRARAIVRHTDDDRVVELAQPLNEVDQASEVMIGLGEEPGCT